MIDFEKDYRISTSAHCRKCKVSLTLGGTDHDTAIYLAVQHERERHQEGRIYCDHLWGYQNGTDPSKCIRCGRDRPRCPKHSEVLLYGPMNGWTGDPDDPKAYFGCDACYPEA